MWQFIVLNSDFKIKTFKKPQNFYSLQIDNWFNIKKFQLKYEVVCDIQEKYFPSWTLIQLINSTKNQTNFEDN